MKKLMVFTGADWAEITGTPGRDGRIPVAGVDYPIPKDGKTIVGPAGKDGISPSVETIVAAVLKDIQKGKKLTIDHIDGLTGSLGQLKEFLKAGGYRGGGDVIAAGGGISVTVNSNGQKVITNTGSSSTIYTETPVGLIDGANKTYTTLHSITTVLGFNINGMFIHPAEYSISGAIITFVVALDASLAGTGFTIVYQ